MHIETIGHTFKERLHLIVRDVFYLMFG